MEYSDTILYREVQYMRRVWWVMLLVLGICALMWWGFYQQIILGEPWGSKPGPDWFLWLFWLIFGIFFPVVFYLMCLIVEVTDDQITIRYFPLLKRMISISEIKEVEARTYKPIREFGGWGIRGGSNKMAYTVSGNRGVEVSLNDGRSILIGSQKPEELALAILAKLPKF
jgi:FtsH-binding integral membrane protein